MKKSLIITGVVIAVAVAAALVIPSPGPKVELRGNVQPHNTTESTNTSVYSTPLETVPPDDPVPVDATPVAMASAPADQPLAVTPAPAPIVTPVPSPTPCVPGTVDANGSVCVSDTIGGPIKVCSNFPPPVGRVCTIKQ